MGRRRSFKARLVSGGDVAIPAAQLAALDFSAGKIRYLSQLEPRDVQYVPFFDIYRTNTAATGASTARP